jgi:hypothetical protein
MHHSGFKWTLRPEGPAWRWQAIGRDDGRIVAEGLARSRAEAAAWLARTMSLAVVAGERLAA